MKANAIVVLAALLVGLVSTDAARGQQCGPGCPACSGKSVGAMLPQAQISGSSLYIPNPDGWRPALLVATGSVQTGGSDQSGYIQLAKTLELAEGRLGISLAGGYATDLPDLEEDWVLGTFSMTL